MSEQRIKQLIQEAVNLLQANKNLSVPQAMRAVEFSKKNSKCRTMQMRVRRALTTTQPPNTIDASQISNGSNRSDITMPSAILEPSLNSIRESCARVSQMSNGSNRSDITEPSLNSPSARVRSTSVQVQIRRRNKAEEKLNEKRALKAATRLFESERKKKRGMSSEDVAGTINAEYKSNVTGRTIRRYVKNGLVGCSPLKRGERGTIPSPIFRALVEAFETFIQIEQANGERQTKQCGLSRIVNLVINGSGENRTHYDLLYRLLTR